MGIDGYEPLSFADNILLMRIKLSCAAFGLFLFALMSDWLVWPGRAVVLAISALLVLLARQIDGLFARLAGIDPKAEAGAAFDHHPAPFRTGRAVKSPSRHRRPDPAR